MYRNVAWLGISCAVGFCLSDPVCGADKTKGASFDAVQRVLHSELQSLTRSIDRRDALRPDLQSRHELTSTYWQSGYVLSGKQWLPFEKSVVNGASELLLDEYQVQRSKLSSQPHGQWQLANWCRKHGMPDQERVHLLRVVADKDSTVKSDSVFERLNYQKIGDVWVSPQERHELVRINAEMERSHQRWDTKLATWIELLDGSPTQRAGAQKQMSELNDVSAVPAIVSVLCLRSQPLAEHGVKMLGQIPEFQASRALAGQAIFSPWRPVRVRASELLKRRPLEDYVPDLLSLLASPVRVEVAPAASNSSGPEAKINWEYAWIEETQDTIWVSLGRLIPTSLPAGIVQVKSGVIPGFLEFQAPGGQHFNAETVLSVAFKDMAEELSEMKFYAERTTDLRSVMNERVTKTLADCTDEPINSDPKVWWQWWTMHASVSPSEKQVVVVSDKRRDQPVIPTIKCSCLVAGTPVWSERGSVAIEQIQPGDRVLSEDPDSGELKYKPVLQTTVREPTPIQEIHVADDEISASPGHHFWVSGAGWMKTRQLIADAPLHTATGMEKIDRTIDAGRSERVYNLVVADFHTYFVGKSMILSHDVTTPRLTNVKIPGLMKE